MEEKVSENEVIYTPTEKRRIDMLVKNGWTRTYEEYMGNPYTFTKEIIDGDGVVIRLHYDVRTGACY